ncbi:MAG: TlpA family protein disulfide reductase [Actinobacteria bacterium]|nr:TlpA family protein disulfide reductase [Actinomycetota bacterium]
MRKLLILLLIPLLMACSSNRVTSGDEQAFISGNGVATYISPDNRKEAPNISGPTLSGGSFKSEPGKLLVVNVWASWCSPCRAEAGALQELSLAYPEVQFLGVLTRDTKVAAQSFVDRFGITYPSLTDDAILLEFHGQLIPNAIPTTLIIDSKSRVAARISGEVTYTSLKQLIEKVKSDE